MEFGIFLNGYIPGPAAHDTYLEHEMFRCARPSTPSLADKHNWKYAWFGEHHSLTEYSHLSASEVMIGYCARATERIHLGSAIVSLPPVKDHPVRVAERAATLDHLTNQRYEFGTGRGAGSHEVATFGIMDTDETKPMWDEVIREIPRMWEQRDYSFEGEFFKVPYSAQHPPEAVRQGAPADVGGVRQPADVRQGGLDRHRRDRLQLRADPQPQGPGRRVQGGDPVPDRADRPVQERQRDDDERRRLPEGPQPCARDRDDARAAATS